MEEKNPAYEWFNYGLTKEDPIDRFMTFWVAFNSLYSKCGKVWERQNIEQFCNDNYETLSRYEAFSSDAFAVFLKKPVKNEECCDEEKQKNHNKRSERLFNDINRMGNEKRRTISLILTIYQVRCNLFHGEKKPSNNRDISLIEASAEIMKGYLNKLLEKPEQLPEYTK